MQEFPRTRPLVIPAVVLLLLIGSFGYLAFVTGDREITPLEPPPTEALPSPPTGGFEGTGKSDAPFPPVFTWEPPGSVSANPSGQRPRPSLPADPKALTVDVGPVELLFPGVTRAVPLTVSNPFGFAIDVHTIEVASTGTSPCPRRYLVLRSYDVGGPVIPSRSEAPVSTHIALTKDAPDGCQGEQLTIRVTVRAGRA